MSQMMETKELIPHARNDFFFDDITGEPWQEFLKSVKTSGIIEPLVISQDKVIVSGHQRLRAAKELGIDKVPVEVRIYESEDELLKQLIETNIRQRGLGNGNPVKLGRCLKELERIEGIRDGSANSPGTNRIGDGNNFRDQKTQTDLAKELGMTERTLRNYKALADASPTMQEILEEGKITPTSALKLIRSLPEDEQEEVASHIWEQGKVTGKDVDELLKQIAERDAKVENLTKELEQKITQAHEAKRTEIELRAQIEELEEANEGLMAPSDEMELYREAIKEKQELLREQADKIGSLEAEIEATKKALEEEKALRPTKEVTVEKVVEVERVVDPEEYEALRREAVGSGVEADMERENRERLEALLAVLTKKNGAQPLDEVVAGSMAVSLFFHQNVEAIMKANPSEMARRLDALTGDDRLKCVMAANDLIRWLKGFVAAMGDVPRREAVYEELEKEQKNGNL